MWIIEIYLKDNHKILYEALETTIHIGKYFESIDDFT